MALLINLQNLTDSSRKIKENFQYNDLIKLTYENGAIIEKRFDFMNNEEYKTYLLQQSLDPEETSISDEDPRLIEYEATKPINIKYWMETI